MGETWGYKAIFPEEPPPYYKIMIRVALNVDPPSNRAVVVENNWSLVFNGRVAGAVVGIVQSPSVNPNPTLTIRFN